MRAGRQPPSMTELCNIYRKKKELMWKSNQPGSEIDEAPHTSSDQLAPSSASKRQNISETTDSRRRRPLCLPPISPCVTAKESRISYLSAEKKSNLRYPEKTDDQRFSPVETPTEFFKSDAVKSSSDKAFYSFDDDSTQPGQFQKRQIYRMRATDAELYPAESHTMCPLPGDEKNMYGEEIYEKRKNSPGRSNQSSYQLTQANPRHYLQYQSRYSLKQAGSYSPNSDIQCVSSLHQVQGSGETFPNRQTNISSLNLQKNAQWDGAGPSIRRNTCSDTAVTTLPPIQQRTRKTPDRLRQSRVPVEQRSDALLRVRRYGRQEVCEGENAENRMSRRQGVCKETDSTQEWEDGFNVKIGIVSYMLPLNLSFATC